MAVPPLHAEPARLPRRAHLLALLGYAALALLLTWPLAPNFGRALVGGPGVVFTFEDGSQNVWNMWWIARALTGGANPFWTPLLYFPEGVQMLVQTLNFSNGLLALPVTLAAGPVAGYHAAVLLGVALTGYAGFLLARAFAPHPLAAWLCGALLTAAPFHTLTLQNNQLQLITMQWVPLYLLALLHLERGQGDRGRRGMPSSATGSLPPPLPLSPAPPLLAAAALLLLALTDWYWALICGLFTAAYAGLGLLFARDRAALARRYAAFAALAALALAPLALGLVGLRDSLRRIEQLDAPIWDEYVRGFSADALGLFMPTLYRPWAQALWPVGRPDFGVEGWYVGAGWTLLACALVGLAAAWRAHWRLLAAGAMLWLLSLGPSLWLNGVDTGLPMPYALLRELPLIAIARRPALFAVVCIVLLVPFAALGLGRLLAGRPRPARALLLAAVAALALAELWPPPRAVFDMRPPPVYAEIAARPGAVVDLPAKLRTEDARTLRGQLAHGQPIVGGYVARWPAYDALRYSPLLYALATPAALPEADIVPMDAGALAAMQCYAPVRHLVLQTELLSAEQLEVAAAMAGRVAGAPLAPAFADATHRRYELPAHADRCAPFLALGGGWFRLEQQGDAVWRWAQGTPRLWAVNPYCAPLAATLELRGRAYAEPRDVEVWRGDALLARWRMGTEPRRYLVRLELPPGPTLLQLRASVAPEPEGPRELSFLAERVRLRGYAPSLSPGTTSSSQPLCTPAAKR